MSFPRIFTQQEGHITAECECLVSSKIHILCDCIISNTRNRKRRRYQQRKQQNNYKLINDKPIPAYHHHMYYKKRLLSDSLLTPHPERSWGLAIPSALAFSAQGPFNMNVLPWWHNSLALLIRIQILLLLHKRNWSSFFERKEMIKDITCFQMFEFMLIRKYNNNS